MEIATTCPLHLFPKQQRVQSRGVRFNLLDVSSLPAINPKPHDTRVLGRAGRHGTETCDAPKKRQHRSDEETPSSVKRQKKTVVEVDSTTTKAKSIRKLTPSLHKPESESETLPKVTKPVDARAITTKIAKPVDARAITTKIAKPENSTTAKPDGRIDLKNLIAKAQHKIHEKSHIDHRREHIARQRIAARLALNEMVATVFFDHHLNYYKELEQLGYTFMRDELDCLNMFSLWSRSDYNGETNSVLE
ncbi:PREDICTED: uncharacterized protein LOC104743603, partial [Camelina sativa]|uniref:Uncharacterized protein LOC104743603 n=1 Tax=Camelina sativa TaxID=90675 RepID=A0ABM0VY98_CAMSA